MRHRIKNFRNNLELYSKMTDITSISRRYFVIGFFDGVLTILGMIIGAHAVGEVSSRLIISAGIATALALGISSSWGAFEAERIEQKITKDEKNKALLVNSRESSIDKAHRFATYVSSIVHGVAPIIAASIPLLPYTVLPIEEAFIAAVSLSFLSLFTVGAVMGKVARFNIIMSGLRLMLAGILTALLVAILSPSHFI